MSERETNDTTQTPVGSHPHRARRSGRSYYYDDATGYEIYDPEADGAEETEEDCQEDDQGDAPEDEGA